MTEQFLMKVTMVLIVLGAGIALLISHRQAIDKRDLTEQLKGSGWEGDLDEMKSSKIDNQSNRQ